MPLTDYTHHSPITDPGAFTPLLDSLPADPPVLAEIVQGLLIHKLVAEHYQVHLSRVQRSEQMLRTVQQRLASLLEVDSAPLVEARPPVMRQVGVCRDFAVLHVALLRQKGIPARMRVGFAAYLDPQGVYRYDHWISEYWKADEERWILFDPQIDDLQREMLHLTCDPQDLRRDRDFFLAGSAWQRCREGLDKSLLFRFNGHWKGMPCIRGNLLHDFQALNHLELGVFDYWDDLSRKPDSALSVEEKNLLDQIAGLTVGADEHYAELRQLFDDLPRTQRIRSRLRLLGLLPQEDERESSLALDLKPSEAERLAALRTPKEPAPQAKVVPLAAYTPDELPDDHPANQPGNEAPTGIGDIVVRGARQHNLKNISLRIPRNRLVVITGVSGSGKSSLAFDTIYAEGQRRYVESLSSYARQFMGQMEKPQVDQISGLSPAVAIEQKTISRNPRSTVGTVTEILDYLRVLFARTGLPHCPQCGCAVQPQSAQQICNQLSALPDETRFELLAPVVRNRKGAFSSLLRQAVKDGYTRARLDGETLDLADGPPEIDPHKKHSIDLVIDRLVVPAADRDTNAEDRRDFFSRLFDSVETTLKAGQGVLKVALANGETMVLSEHNACPVCEISFAALEPHLFSFNSPLGMCEECNGLGIKLQVDAALIIEHPELSLMDGASRWYRDLRLKGENAWQTRNLISIAEHYGVDLNLPWNELPEAFRNVILYGSGGEKVHFEFEVENDQGTWRGESVRDVKGVIHHINRLFRQTKSEYTRRYYMSFMNQLACPHCQGERLNPEARLVTVDGQRLPELTSWSIEALYQWTANLEARLDEERRQIGGELIREINQRLGFIRNVGLHYLTLDRPAPSLSGGEGQRIRLASQIGSGLVGVLYILDEPSIGLHARDHRALLDTLMHLRDSGNTVLVVEHDETTMRTADWLIDLGPGPGILGGEVVAAGTPEEIILDPHSLTGRYLSGELSIGAKTANGGRRTPKGWLTVRGARLHNLKNIDTAFPLGVLTLVTGVSGSGKSSLISQTLYPALARSLHRAQSVPGPHDSIEGLEQVDKVINITQDPIGRNPRSNPGTYVGVLDDIRAVFASTPEAKALGFGAGRFSFNVKGGRCEECSGYGFKQVEMHFLADVWVRCKSCGGKRFNQQTLVITYKGKTIADVLDMDVQEALEFFGNYPDIRRILQTLHDVGLDYIKLGQSALTLSGGEAQRVKLAKELSRISTGRTIYILDEPTTGLHFADEQRLLDVLHRLVDAGNSVIVIEHNLDIIKTADWVLDLGPEGGEKGGYIVAQGAPEQIALSGSLTGQYLKPLLKEALLAPSQ